MNTYIKAMIRIVFSVLTICMLFSCDNNSTLNDNGNEYENDTIRINYSMTYGNIVPHIVKLKGLLDNKIPDEIKIEWSAIENSTDIRDSLVAEKLDIGMVTMVTAISSTENNLPIVLLANSAISSSRIYSCNPEIKSLDDIRQNHRISINNIGARDHLSLMLLSIDKYEDAEIFNNNLVTMPYSDMIASLASSNYIDCSIISFPSYAAADTLENVTLISDLTETIQKYQLSHVCVASASFMEKNPALVKAVLDALQEAMDFLNNNPAEAAELLSHYYAGVEASAIEAHIKAVPLSPEISESAYNNTAALMYEVGILPDLPKNFSELPNYSSIPKIL